MFSDFSFFEMCEMLKYVFLLKRICFAWIFVRNFNKILQKLKHVPCVNVSPSEVRNTLKGPGCYMRGGVVQAVDRCESSSIYHSK